MLYYALLLLRNAHQSFTGLISLCFGVVLSYKAVTSLSDLNVWAVQLRAHLHCKQKKNNYCSKLQIIMGNTFCPEKGTNSDIDHLLMHVWQPKVTFKWYSAHTKIWNKDWQLKGIEEVMNITKHFHVSLTCVSGWIGFVN
jgi:hypothetical protein